MRHALFAPLFALAASAHAHSGHGVGDGSHWHASDAWGFVAAGALVLLAIWLSRGGK